MLRVKIGAGVVVVAYCSATLVILDAHLLPQDEPVPEAHAKTTSDFVLKPATDNGSIGTYYSGR